MFTSTYGFSAGAKNKPHLRGELVHKVMCADNSAEIYQIGTIHMEQRLSDKIYVLIWKEKVIPFVVPLPLIITEKEITRHKTHNGRKYVLANYKIPVASILVKDVGKDLLKLPRGRDHHAYYDRHCFLCEDRHYYAFENEEEYQQAIELINLGLPILLYDQYEYHSYNPLLSAEIVFAVGPWNFEDELYYKEVEERKRHYDSEYRQCYGINWNLERARKNLGKKDEELKRLRENSKWSPVLKKVNKTRFSMNKQAKRAAKTCMKLFKKNVRSLEDFFEFLRVRPALEKDDLKEVIGSDGKVRRVGSFRSAIQGQEDWEAFLELLVTSNHPILNEFEKYKNSLKEQAVNAVENHIPANRELYDFHGASEKLKRFVSENTVPSVEEIMAFLISLERQFHAESGSYFDIRIIQEKVFIDLIKKSYKQLYSEKCTSYESLLISITKTMTARIEHRVAREQADSKVVKQ